MPIVSPEKPLKRNVKKITTAEAKIVAAAPILNRSHHGLAAVTIILSFLVFGCLAASALMSEKTKIAVSYAQDLAVRLIESQKKNNELTDQLMNLKTLQALAKKVMAPISPPDNIVWDTYTSQNLSIQYPNDYAVVKATAAFPALTIKNDKGRIEIFRMKDFSGGDRSLGLKDPAVTQEDIDNKIPKEFKMAPLAPTDSKVQPYSVWIYYGINDETTKAILDQAVATIRVVK